MDPQFEGIYLEQMNLRMVEFDYSQINQMVLSVSMAMGVSLRQDAVYFLTNNITDMVYAPLKIALARNLKLNVGILVPVDTLLSYIESDIGTIISSAQTVPADPDAQKMSAARIIAGLGPVIEKLQINQTKLWGR
jgi:hypothetical protein